MPDPRQSAVGARRVVVKLGTALLTDGRDALDRAFMRDMGVQFARLRDSGREVIVVSSGAVGAGLAKLGFSRRPSDLSELQAAAAAGQPLLMTLWRDAMAERGIAVAQLLVGRTDFDARDRFLNIRNCLSCLHERGTIPIVNENDSVATDEISLGDNDVLAAKLATAVRADALVLLTTVEGVQDEQGGLIGEAGDARELVRHVRAERSAQGRGGMGTKVEAARIASLGGLVTIIARGRPPEQLGRILAGERVGTCIGADPRHAGRRLWIALTATPLGSIEIDEGAMRAVVQRGASLLAKGVTGTTGRFGVGDVVVVHDHQGREVARGLSNLTADELRIVRGRDSSEFEGLLGRRAHHEVIHRDNLAITAAG